MIARQMLHAMESNKKIVLVNKYKILQFGAFVFDSGEKQMLSTISLVIEQRKNKFDRITRVWFSPIYFYTLQG
jgi:hypothetical protein